MKRYTVIIVALFTVQSVVSDQYGNDSSALVAGENNSSVFSQKDDSSASEGKDATATKNTDDVSKVKFSASIDMQADKQMYDEQSDDLVNSPTRYNRFTKGDYFRKVVDDFWMRVDFRGLYKSKFLESAFALRFYPKWTKRLQDAPGGTEFGYLPLFELNRAYLKAFKDYSNNQIYFKIGRDGMLNSCSQLFGNYLDHPVGGYGASMKENTLGPFKNKTVFANQMEVNVKLGFLNICGAAIDMTSKSSIMIGGSVNNEKWYTAPTLPLVEQMDSDLSAGFLRLYQDFFLLNNRLHLGIGYRNYSARIDSLTVLTTAHYINYAVTFDAVIIKDLKFYTEVGYQKLGMISSRDILRPINVGITIPTGKALDTLAIELENVGKTFFSDESMRDPIIGRMTTTALAWGIEAEKLYANRFRVAWGLYTGSSYGDMKTSLRLSSYF